MKNKNPFSMPILLGLGLAGLLALAGCATSGPYVGDSVGFSQDKFYDEWGDWKLIGRRNDIYLERRDGSESRKITHTQDIPEGEACFSKDGKYIAYWEDANIVDGFAPSYLIKFGSDDSTRVKITSLEFVHMRAEK